MIDKALEFFKNILETPSPSGYEQPVQKVVREYASDFADKIDNDSHGNVIAVKNPQASLRVMYVDFNFGATWSFVYRLTTRTNQP